MVVSPDKAPGGMFTPEPSGAVTLPPDEPIVFFTTVPLGLLQAPARIRQTRLVRIR